MKKISEHVQKALDILNKQGVGTKSQEILNLVKELKKENAFGYARRILELARKDRSIDYQTGLKLDQECALCTYKDPDLPLTKRLEYALKTLKEGRLDLHHITDQETLGLAGAIYKRKWEADGEIQHLERSLYYYDRGYQQGPEKDQGYTSINAAYILDLLAHQASIESKEVGKTSVSVQQYQEKARKIRNHLIESLVPEESLKSKNYWLLVTIAEAYFGLEEFEKAKPWLTKAKDLEGTEEWHVESTTRQLAHLAMLHEAKDAQQIQTSPAWQVLLFFTNIQPVALQNLFAGKVGLALSGGGFRASLYHIGVLAHLAEKDMLRYVEVLSCVSGGSIIGAYYYLELRHLLQTHTDDQITQQDYIDIVQRVAQHFLTGVQRNIRTRIATNLWENIKMIFYRNYSQTNRIGKLYEKELYAKVEDREGQDPRWLNKLFIHPLDNDGQPMTTFNPKYHNWKRKHKVPILILNATTLNTGHNWQFTASFMGESPASIQEVDGNYRLRRMYYEDKEDSPRKIRLGYAVAASSCVPGLFEPLALPNLYPDKIVRLVDGGVHDNQGIVGLLEQDCSVVLVSDASGQMGTLDDPQHTTLGVPLRSNDILMERVRNAQFQDLENRWRSGILKGLMFIHLKMGLDVELVDWDKCEDPSDETFVNTKSKATLTPYNIRKDMQKILAAIRTDLDSFHDTEAYALMTSGYQMCKYGFAKSVQGFPSVKGNSPAWSFLKMAPELKTADTPEHTIHLLEMGQERMFKIWRMLPVLKVIGGLLGIATLLAFFWLVIKWSTQPLLTVGDVGWIVATILLGLVVGKTIIRIIRYRKTLTQMGAGLGLAIFGWVVAHIHLLIFDKMYLRKGSRNRK